MELYGIGWSWTRQKWMVLTYSNNNFKADEKEKGSTPNLFLSVIWS